MVDFTERYKYKELQQKWNRLLEHYHKNEMKESYVDYLNATEKRGYINIGYDSMDKKVIEKIYQDVFSKV